jgi:hypothetical protein
MVRISLCLYLVLVMLAGPALCCCTSQRLVAEFAAASGGKKPRQSPAHSCCSRQATENQHHESPRDSGKRDQPNRSPCPCKEQGSHSIPLLSGEAEAIQQLLAKQSLQALTPVLTVPAISDALFPQGNSGMFGEASALPFLSTEDILHTLHILRC